MRLTLSLTRWLLLACLGWLLAACAPSASPPAAPAASSGGSVSTVPTSATSSQPTPPAAPPLTKVRFGYAAISSYQAHAVLGKDAGIFQKHGLDVELIYL